MNKQTFISRFSRKKRVQKYLASYQIIPEKEGEYKEPIVPFQEPIHSWLSNLNIRLFTHQTKCLELLRSGNHVILTTPTASGKTLAYNVPIVEGLLSNEEARALYLFPTKALTNDQWKTLKKIDSALTKTLKPSVYDGDTPKQKRSTIRRKSRIVLSNPYMLHMILPWHHLWANFFGNLQYIVLDEAHYYRGVFGSNVAMLIRRLKRICAHYGSNPLFFLSTATIANPESFSQKLIGETCVHVSENGSPSGKKHFLLYNPYQDEMNNSTANIETEWLLEQLVENNIQTICFSLSRRNTEWITQKVSKYFQKKYPLRGNSLVASYRGGYLAEDRRDIENQLKKGNLKGIVSTNALEAGIDIGSLDSVLMNGYPGTMISTWQQAGRSGRGCSDSLAILVARQNPLDQYFMKHPDLFFSRSSEHAIIDTQNPYILWGHLLCAAKEIPLQETDETYFGNSFIEDVQYLTSEKLLKNHQNRWLYNLPDEPFKNISINNIGGELYSMFSAEGMLETLDKEQAFREAYEGAIYLHQGESYLVRKLDTVKHIISVEKTNTPFHTEPLVHTDVVVLNKWESKSSELVELSFGKVNVTEEYYAYQIKKGTTVLNEIPLALPSTIFDTTSLWLDIKLPLQKKLLSTFDTKILQGGIHGAEHAIIAIMPLYVLCDRRDLGGISTLYHPDTGCIRIFIYDGFMGGIGLSEKGYQLIHSLIDSALELVRDCSCDSEDGCPACIHSPKCGNDNKILHKQGTIEFLEILREYL